MTDSTTPVKISKQLKYQKKHYAEHLNRMKSYYIRKDKVLLKKKRTAYLLLVKELKTQRNILFE